MSTWKPVRKVRAHELVIRQIEERIVAGELQPGDRLPGERQLSELLNVGRSSVREALRVLEALGIVVARTGQGEASGSVIASSEGEALASLLRMQLALDRYSVDDVVEMRVMTETWAVRQAAKRTATGRGADAFLKDLHDQVAAMGEEGIDITRFLALDTEFHVGVAAAAQNRLVSHWMHALRECIRREMTVAFEAVEDWQATTATLRAEHAEVLEAIEAGEGERAATLVEAHIRVFYAVDGPRPPPLRSR